MGNHKSKKLEAERHNALYAARRGETAKQPTKPTINIGSVGHVDQDKRTLTKAISKAPKKPKRGAWWRKYALPDVFWVLLAAGLFSSYSDWGWQL